MSFLSPNIGGVERGVRALIGLAVMLLAVTGPRTPWGWLGIVPLLTAITGWCPLYRALRISTRRGPQ